MIVLDASAILAYLQGEEGSAVVERQLDDDAICGAANWSEVRFRAPAATGRWPAPFWPATIS